MKVTFTKILPLVLVLLLSAVSIKAEVLPSTCYSEAAAGTFYLYNVAQGKFLERLSNNYPGLSSSPAEVTLAKSGDGFTICFSDGKYLKTGYWNNQYLWTDGEAGRTESVWTFDAIAGAEKVYQLRRTSADILEGKNGIFYANGANADIVCTDDCQWALIDMVEYYLGNAPLAKYRSGINSIPSEGEQYYLFDVQRRKFLNTANCTLTDAPSALATITPSGSKFLISGAAGKYLKIGVSGTQYLWSDGGETSTKWTFEESGVEGQLAYYIYTDEFILGDNETKPGDIMYLTESNASAVKPSFARWVLITQDGYDMAVSYQKYVDLRTTIEEGLKVSTGDKATLNSAIAKQNEAVNAAMTVKEIDDAREGLLKAYKVYWKSAQPTEGNVVDYTVMLKNPTCAEDNGWEKFEGNASNGYNVNLDGRKGVETWVQAGTARKNMNLIWQTVEGLQPGKYTFKAYAVGRDQTRSGEPYNGSLYLFANDNVTEVNGRTWIERTVECIVLEDGKLTVGIAAGPDNENEWNAITDATLMYEGSVGKTDTEWMADVLAAKNAEAKTYETKHPGINPKYLELLSNETVLGENATVEDYRAAIKSRNEEMATAYSMIPAYDSFQKTKDCADKLQKVASDATEVVKSAFSSSIEEQGEAADNAMDVNAVRQAEENLLQAGRDYVRNASPAEGSQFDITHFYLVNADLTGLATWTAQDGWYTDTNKKIQCMQNSEVISADGKNYFYEIYGGSRTPLPTGWNLYQKVNLPAGNYEMTAYVFGKGVNDNYSGELNGTLCAGDVKGDAMTAANLTEGHVAFSLLDNVADMKLGLCVEEGTTANWAGVGYMKLYKKENVAQSLDEKSETYDVQGDVYSNVTMSRVLNGDEKWNTFCVPFAMTSEQLSANGIKEVRVLDEATVGTDHATLKFTQVDAIEPGKPYIVKVSVPVSEIKVSGVALQSSMNDIYSNGVTMKGNYAKGVVPDGAFFINNNAFYLADTENSEQKVTLKGFRAYIEVSEPVVSNINRMLIDIDGETTSVEDVLGGEVPGESRTVDVYSLSGVKVKSGVKPSEALDGLKKGIYVVEGKKVIK